MKTIETIIEAIGIKTENHFKHSLTLENIKYKGYQIKPQGRVDFKLREAYEVNGQIVYGMKAAKQLIDKLLSA